jgi:hypothetical protein
MRRINIILTATLFLVTLIGCTSQTMSTQVRFQDVGSIPPPRNGPVYVELTGEAKDLEETINSSAHLTTLPPSPESKPVFSIYAERSIYRRNQDDFIWIPALVAMIIPAQGTTTLEWEIKLKSSSERYYPSTYEYAFKRKWYLSFFPHVYLFGKYSDFGETPEVIVQSEKAHVVSNIIFEANKKGFLNKNK